jgi:uncharacterized membrane protein YphA (DoxX/SURF4 family)
MDVALWTCQGLLAAVFIYSGLQKSIQSKDRMIETGQTGVRPYSLPFIRFIALAELAGAAGLILPWATKILPALTPLAASGLGVIMIGAARAHARQHEPKNVTTSLVLLTLCGLVAIGRLA